MYRSIFIFSLIGALFPLNIQATEYLRFQGSINDFYSEGEPGYDAALGFVPNKRVYFDFRIDTNLDAEDKLDSSFEDYFDVTYLSGSIGGSNTTTYGVTTTFPEGITTWLFVTDSLRVGTSWDTLNNESNESIDTWTVGDHISLMNNGYFSENIIGNLEMTYRGAEAPPSIPIPASLWLFVSGLSLLSFLKRK